MSFESLYYAFCQYWPIIEEGEEEVQEIILSEVSKPASVSEVKIDGVTVMDPVLISKGDDAELAKLLADKMAENMNNRASSRDNEIQVRATASDGVAGNKVSMNIRYTNSFKTSDDNVSVSALGTNVTFAYNQVQDAAVFTETDDHYCLNEEELQGLIDNFNALCGCGCGKNMFTDQLPKYLRQ